LRVEYTSTEGEAAEFDADEEIATPQKESNSYTNWFPSVHLRHELDNEVILRAAYSTAVSRPNFQDLVPYVIIEDRESGRGTIELGNPDLNETFAHNFDLLAEYYIEPLGLISGGLFYKDISDPIFESSTTLTEGEFAGFRQTRPENGRNGELYGFELNWQQRFDFLPGYWAGLGIFANYTFTESSADLPFGAGKTDLQGTSRDTYNLALQYDINRFSTKLSYNYRSEYIDAFDTSDPSLNIYWDERGTLDLTASFDINDTFAVYLEATNLTDSKGLRYQGNTSRVYEHEKFGESWLIGIKASF
jgi:TonB-dependent receptor